LLYFVRPSVTIYMYRSVFIKLVVKILDGRTTVYMCIQKLYCGIVFVNYDDHVYSEDGLNYLSFISRIPGAKNITILNSEV
jgi:hypothetical protein